MTLTGDSPQKRAWKTRKKNQRGRGAPKTYALKTQLLNEAKHLEYRARLLRKVAATLA